MDRGPELRVRESGTPPRRVGASGLQFRAMTEAPTTCWTLIRDAAAGDGLGREEFVRRYRAVVEAYLRARWRGGVLGDEVGDAVQEVWFECLKDGGALERVREGRAAGFRGFLYGVTRNVAGRAEERWGQKRERDFGTSLDQRLPGLQEEDLRREFDRAWAAAVVREAGELQAERARALGEAAEKRVELLRLRFGEGVPIRELAERWQVAPRKLHKEYALAREEFEAALREVVKFHDPGSPEGVEAECRDLIALLG